ncbi:MAG: hypothetical protein R3F59_22160 [Myxococcota bacterium]
MSRAYQIRVAETLTHHVRVDDGIQTNLELIGVLVPERTAEIVAQELEQRGYTIDGTKARREVAPGIVVEVDTLEGTVNVRATAEQEIELSAERTVRSYQPDGGDAKDSASEALKSDLARQAAEQDEEARQALSDRLDAALAEIKPELDAVADAVTRAALKERAGQMGEIMEISENEAGEMTIRVRV